MSINLIDGITIGAIFATFSMLPGIFCIMRETTWISRSTDALLRGDDERRSYCEEREAFWHKWASRTDWMSKVFRLK